MKTVIKTFSKMKNLLIIIIFLTCKYSFSQSKELIYVKIEKNKTKKLYSFEKTDNNNAKIKILYFEKRNKGFQNTQKSKNKDEIILVDSLPNSYYYEFTSVRNPKQINSLKNIKFHSIEGISKHQVWNKEYPHTIFFIEKISKCSYYLWEMIPLINE